MDGNSWQQVIAKGSLAYLFETARLDISYLSQAKGEE
jgi:hypothetical protein